MSKICIFRNWGNADFLCNNSILLLKKKINKNIFIEINYKDNKILNTKYLCAMIINRTKSKDVLITGLRLYFRK